MKIGIVGQGFVGTAVHEGLKQYHKIETYDIAKTSTCKSLADLSEKSDQLYPQVLLKCGIKNLKIYK